MLDAPASAQLVQAFANTLDVEEGTDELDTARKLDTWLREQGLLRGGAQVHSPDHALCLRMRAGIREELGVHVGDQADPALQREATAALRELPVVVTTGVGDTGAADAGTVPTESGTTSTGGHSVLVPDPDLTAPRKALAALAIAWSELAVTGEAARLKRCSEHACAWVFWDTSKNRSRRWCSMRVCGNRAKARRYAARQSTETLSGTPAE
ncbi:CGNR zinc finger domain-containing protein [Streptomyces sp. NPDC002795]|uniref:CGNR zinc finger domain-containing protein n=1 Tax=Streptomyces sp. NPDC002795 TaxID=3364665 RepID=UPI0036CF8C43